MNSDDARATKRALVWTSLLALVGVVGFTLSSGQLLAFAPFALLVLLIPIRVGSTFPKRMRVTMRWTLIAALFAFGTVFAFATLLQNTPMIIDGTPLDVLLLLFVEALSWAFAVTIALFVVLTLASAVRSVREPAGERA